MREYLEKYRGHLFLIGLFVFLLHGAKLNSGIIGIDTEDLIHLKDGFYGGWLHTGRQGLVLLKYIFGNALFNPFYSGGMTLLLCVVAVASFLLLWDRAGGGKRSLLAWGLGGLLWISHPAMVEQFYFSLQSMEICLAFALTALALYLSYRCTWGGRRFVEAACSVCLLVLTFSTYQSFVVLYIFGTVALLLLQALREASEDAEMTGGALLRRVLPYCAVFLTAFALNTLITKLFFSSSSYLRDQIFWGEASVGDCFRGILGHVARAFTGNGSIFYNGGLGALALFDLILILVFLNGSCRGKKGAFGVILFFYLALLTTPFLMSVVLGGMPAIRSQLVLPPMTGCLGYLGVRLVLLMEGRLGQAWRVRWLLGAAAAIGLVSGLEQAKVTQSLYYTDSCRYEQDVALGRALIERIERIVQKKGELPVAVLGGREFAGNNSCVTGELVGRSFFCYDMDVPPESYWSTKRVVGFLHTLGGDYEQVSEEWLWEVYECGEDMPVWPAEGSVQEKSGMIIIKLSE